MKHDMMTLIGRGRFSVFHSLTACSLMMRLHDGDTVSFVPRHNLSLRSYGHFSKASYDHVPDFMLYFATITPRVYV